MSMNKSLTAITLAFFAAAFFVAPIAAESEIIKLEAVASFYADEFHGRPTSSGEIFDMNAMTAAHKTLPFGTMLEVTNLENGKKVVVRVNDRGPFVENRELDVSRKAADMLGMIDTGVARVSIRRVDSLDAAAITAGSATADSGPAMAAKPVTAPNPPMDAVPAADSSIQAIHPEPSVKQSAPAMTSLQPTPSPVSDASISWRIQLGAFSREDNATRMVVRLRKDGFNPSFEKFGDLTRVVLAGISNEELSGTRFRLNSAGYEGYIVKQEIR